MRHKHKILIIDVIDNDAIFELTKNLNFHIEYCPGLDEAKIITKLEDISILVLRSSYVITKEWLNNARRLKVIIVAGNGINHIPIQELKKRKIILKNISNASINSVAEYAVCLMIMGLRKITRGIASINEGKWEKDLLVGNEICGKTIGLVGFGNIGQSIAKLLEVFKVNVVYYDLSISNNHGQAEKIDLIELSRVSDVISVQLPLTKKTQNIINEEFFKETKDNLIFINLSRYEVVNMDDLFVALSNNKIQEAFIDPLEKNHLNDLNRFKGLPVSFLPHFGANTYETQKNVGLELLKKIKELEILIEEI